MEAQHLSNQGAVHQGVCIIFNSKILCSSRSKMINDASFEQGCVCLGVRAAGASRDVV